jgi:endogenous inhibitor of DNA gyrase (YacG/DUF329 family)
MKPQNKNKKQKEKIINFITNDTEKKLEKKEWKIIGKRRCPKCNKEITYINKESFRVSKKKNSVCKSCSLTKYPKPYIRKCPNCNKEMIYDKYKSYLWALKNNGWCHKCAGIKTINTRKERNNLYNNRNQSYYSKKKMSLLHKGKNNPFYGKFHTEKNKKLASKRAKSILRTDGWKRKQRLARIKNIKLLCGNISPSYNKKACEYFEKMEKENGWNGYYATKNGEYYIKKLGYWVDYYEPNKNIVIEWDEIRHYNVDKTLKKKDINRMLEIKNYLGCKFIRFNEKLNEIIEY